jgi:hypothetical protein
MACLRSLPDRYSSRSLWAAFLCSNPQPQDSPARQSGYRVQQIIVAGERSALLSAPRREGLLRLGQVLPTSLQFQHMHEAADAASRWFVALDNATLPEHAMGA